MSFISDDLTWAILRNNSSFLRKQKNAILSAEPGNVKNVHSFKYSGLANSKAISVEIDGDNAVLLKKSKRSAQKPKKIFGKSALKTARGPGRNNKTVDASISKVYYRRDLLKATRARQSLISKAASRKANEVTWSVSGRN